MKQTKKFALGLVGAALMTTAITAPVAQAQSAAELRSQVFALEQRLDALEKRGGVKVASGTTLQFGGYVKLDFMYDFEQRQGFAINGGDIRVGAPDDGGFAAQARESRFSIKSTTQTANGPVSALIEVDFFTTTGNELISNSNNPRLRLAYGEWNGIQAGQNWSLFMPIAFGAPQINFSGPAGTVFLRQPQLRYTAPKNGNFTFAASLESSENSSRLQSGGLIAPSAGGVAKTDQLPDFVGSVDWSNGVQRARGALMLTQLNSPTSSDDAIGYGISLAWATPLWAGSDFRGSFQYGDGIGRYISTGVGNAAVIRTADGKVDTIESWGGSLSLSQKLSDTMSIAAAAGYYKVEDTYAPTDVDHLNTVGVTLFYNPNAKVTFGTEFIWTRKELQNGANEAASRLQGSVQFKF